MAIIDYLKKTDIFSDLDKDTLNSLASMAELRRLKPREFLFNEGFEGTHFFILIEGSIRVFKTSPEGKESTIKILRPGEFFAEAVLFGKREYPASAAAAAESAVIAVHRDSFCTMLENRESRNAFIASLFGKLRFLAERIHYLSSHDVEERFFRFLAGTYGKKYRYDIDIPKRDLASAIGTIPETLSRLILRLTKHGTIHWEKSTLIIRDGFWESEYDGE